MSTTSMSESFPRGVSLEKRSDSSEVETLVRTSFGEQVVNSIESLRRERIGLKPEGGVGRFSSSLS